MRHPIRCDIMRVRAKTHPFASAACLSGRHSNCHKLDCTCPCHREEDDHDL